MAVSLLVDLVNNAGKRCGFTAACGTCDKHKTFCSCYCIGYDLLRNVKLIVIGYIKFNYTDDRRHTSSLLVRTYTKTAESLYGYREVIVARFLIS